jgi:ribonuclease HI
VATNGVRRLTRSQTASANAETNIVPNNHENKRQREENNTTKTVLFYRGQINNITNTSAKIWFDGACRNNGTKFASSSIGVYAGQYDSTFSSAWLLPTTGEKHVTSNNAAELIAATYALSAAIQMAQTYNVKDFTIFGDSDNTIAAIIDGSAMARTLEHGGNSTYWATLAKTLLEAGTLQLNINWQFVPRHLNKEADELCNCALDGRPPNTAVKSHIVDPPTEETLNQLLVLLSHTRRPAMRRIPRTLEHAWTATVNSVLANTASSSRQQRYYFILLPHLLSLNQTRCTGRASFKELRIHVNMLQDMNYLHQSVFELLAKLHQPSVPITRTNNTNINNRIESLVRQELFGRILKTDDAQTAAPTPTNITKLNELFPHSELPQKLPHVAPINTTYGEVLLAAKKLKKGKTPGLTGWTRELLIPALFASNHFHRDYISKTFTSWTNMIDDVTEAEKNIITTGIMSPIEYASKPGKIRPIVMTDTLLKIFWLIVLRDIVDPNMQQSTHAFGRRGACQLVAATVQAALDAGETVVALDATNAYNTLDRQHTFTYIQKHRHTFHRTFHLLNSTYANATKAIWFTGSNTSTIHITSGTIQGCASSLWFYTCGTMEANRHCSARVNNIIRPLIAQAADDVYIVRNSLQFAENVIKTFAEGPKQTLTGPKMRVITATKLQQHQLPECLKRAVIINRPTRILGGIVIPDRERHPEATDAITEICLKLQTKYNALKQLQTSKQVKWLILLNITMHGVYYMESCAIGVDRIAAFLDDLQIDAFESIFETGKLGVCPHDQLFHPIEVGGMGLFPYPQFATHLRERMLRLADEFIKKFGLKREKEQYDTPTTELMTLWNNNLRADMFGTRDWRAQRVSKSWLRLAPSAHETFLRIVPTNILTVMSDEEMTFAMQHRLKLIPIIPGNSCTRNGELDLTDTTQFNNHFASCTSCATYLFYRRHEAVLNALHKCCRFHGYDAELVRNGTNTFALPGNAKGGADIIVHKNGKTYVIDVVITREGTALEGMRNRLTAAFNYKITKYKAYQEQNPTHIVFPFAMTVHGVYHERTIDHLNDLAKHMRIDTEFRTDVLRHTQVALQKAMHEFYLYKKTQLICTHSILSTTILNPPPLVNPPPTETDETEFETPMRSPPQERTPGRATGTTGKKTEGNHR